MDSLGRFDVSIQGLGISNFIEVSYKGRPCSVTSIPLRLALPHEEDYAKTSLLQYGVPSCSATPVGNYQSP